MDLLTTCPCGRPKPHNHRKYCASCSKRASVLWKRRHRAANRGTSYWLDPWLKLGGDERQARAAYNAYMRRYMREYRMRRRGTEVSPRPKPGLPLAESQLAPHWQARQSCQPAEPRLQPVEGTIRP
jgi:hypothetical protein